MLCVKIGDGGVDMLHTAALLLLLSRATVLRFAAALLRRIIAVCTPHLGSHLREVVKSIHFVVITRAIVEAVLWYAATLVYAGADAGCTTHDHLKRPKRVVQFLPS